MRFAIADSPLSKRGENWGDYRRALSYGIVWERTRLKTNARAPPNDPRIERAPTLAPDLEVGYSCFRLLSSVNDLVLASWLVKLYLKLKMLRVKISLKNNTGFSFTVE